MGSGGGRFGAKLILMLLFTLVFLEICDEILQLFTLPDGDTKVGTEGVWYWGMTVWCYVTSGPVRHENYIRDKTSERILQLPHLFDTIPERQADVWEIFCKVLEFNLVSVFLTQKIWLKLWPDLLTQKRSDQSLSDCLMSVNSDSITLMFYSQSNHLLRHLSITYSVSVEVVPPTRSSWVQCLNSGKNVVSKYSNSSLPFSKSPP